MSTSIWFPSDFLSISEKMNQAPSLPFPSLHIHVLSNWKDTSCLYWAHWSEIWLSVELCFPVLVFSHLQGHCLLTLNPKGCIPGCVHLRYVVIPGWYGMMSVWAPRVWWSKGSLLIWYIQRQVATLPNPSWIFWLWWAGHCAERNRGFFLKRPLGSIDIRELSPSS